MKKKKFDKNILLILIPLAILGGIAYMTTRPGGYIREEAHRIVDSEWNSKNIYDVKNYSNYGLSRDGDYAIYTVLESSRDRKGIRLDTVAQNLETGDRLLLLRGSTSIVDFEIDSETNQIFFVTEESGKNQVFTGQFRDGRIVGMEQITNSTTGILSWKLSSDRSKIAYTQLRRASSDNGIEVLGQLNPTDLYLAEPSKSDVRITESNIIINSMDWSPDGRYIAYEYYSSETSGEHDYDESAVEYRTRIREMDIATRTPLDIELNHMGNGAPTYSPDGKYIAYTSERNMDLGLFGTRDIKIYDRSSGSVDTLVSTPNGRPSIEGWTEQGEIYLSDRDRMLEKLYAYSLEEGTVRELVESQSRQANFKLDSKLDKVYFTDESSVDPIEVYSYDLKDQAVSRVTDENQRLLEKDEVKTELISWISEGDLEIEGIIAYPKNYRPSEEYDLVVDIYGGIDNRFTDGYTNPIWEDYPTAILADRGNMVLKINVRGTNGYGEDHRRAVVGDLSRGVSKDIETGIEALRDTVESSIGGVGIISWGYGSYNSAMAIASSDILDFGVLGGGITNIATFLDTTNRNFLSEIYFGGDASENGGLYHEKSPISRVMDVEAPILMIHGSEDRFVAYSQSSIYHNRLRERGIRSNVRLYPRSGHKIEAPDYKTDYMDELIRWMENIRG